MLFRPLPTASGERETFRSALALQYNWMGFKISSVFNIPMNIGKRDEKLLEHHKNDIRSDLEHLIL